MDAYVNSSCISRLLTPNSAGIWSNFEALGAICHVKIEQKTYEWWDIGHLFPIYSSWQNFNDTAAGVEFGYYISGVVP